MLALATLEISADGWLTLVEVPSSLQGHEPRYKTQVSLVGGLALGPGETLTLGPSPGDAFFFLSPKGEKLKTLVGPVIEVRVSWTLFSYNLVPLKAGQRLVHLLRA